MTPTAMANGTPVITENYGQKYNGDIYISGVAGAFPESDSVKELAENLFNKKDLLTDDNRRWGDNFTEIPHRTGKISNLDKYDASFFGTKHKEAHTTDPMQRVLMEKVFECLIDAGMNPEEIRNTRTGVFSGCLITEVTNTWQYDKGQLNEFGLTGCDRFMLANRISQWLELKGPSYNIDTACSSSLFALENAYNAIREGICDAAIVCGTNLVLHPYTSLIFARLGVLSLDGKSKSFDERANGYARSEAVTVCFLQKAEDSRRVYARLVYAKANCDGFKSQGINFPASAMQQKLLEEFYEDCGIDPVSVEFVEAHGTGTRVGDPEEALAIDLVFCKGRKAPLLIGTIKSNLGHGESSSGLNSVTKGCIAYHTGFLPPNINFESPRKDIPALIEGRLQVVTEKTPWNRGYMALSSFGFGGANAHLLLANFPKVKINNGLPTDNLPRLVCVSGRTESAVDKILNDLESRPIDVDEIRLWHAVFDKGIRNHNFRGFVLLESTPDGSVRVARNTQYTSYKPRSVCIKYSSLQLHWHGIAKQLMSLPIFAAAIKRLSVALESVDFNLLKIIKEGQQNKYFLIGSVAIHIGLTDVLKSIGIETDYIISQDFGELSCAYADGCLTAEQSILAAYEINKSIEKLNTSSSVISEQLKELCISQYTEQLLQGLKEIISSPTNQPNHWISKTNGLGGKFSLAEYFVRSLQNPITDVLSRIPTDAIVIEIGVDANPQAISITKENTNALEHLFKSVGTLYLTGFNLKLAELYPPVQFPVAQTTPMLSHLIEWNHDDTWFLPCFDTVAKLECGERQVKVNLNDEEHDYITGHVIDGRVIYPGTGYLLLIWETLASMNHQYIDKVSVVFEDVYFMRATNFPKDGTVEFNITIQSESGRFEITENRITVVTGRVYEKKDVGKEFRAIQKTETNKTIKYDRGLSTKDFYKELSIRGYQYKGQFRGVRHCNVAGTRGSLLWNDNWVTFLDMLLQAQIVSNDSRSLYVPTRIERVTIDVDLHRQNIQANFNSGALEWGSEKTIDFEHYPNLQLIRAGGVEIRGLHFTAISKKPPLGIPVYEKNEFFPNNTENTSLQDAIRANMQLILENIPVYKCKSIELVDEEYETYNLQPIIEIVGDVLGDLPLVQAELVVFSEETLELPSNVTQILNKKVSSESNALVFIGANLLSRKNILEDGFKTLKSNCYVLSRETTHPSKIVCSPKYNIITVHGTGTEYFVLLNEKIKPQRTKYIKVVTGDSSYAWIEETKSEINKGSRIMLYSEDEPVNGLLGLVNCLRKEPGGENVCGVLIADPTAPKFDPSLDFYKNQLDLNLGSNVYKAGQWGTYRHLLMKKQEDVPAVHAYLKPTVMGDLGSLRFLEGPLLPNYLSSDNMKIVHVYCSALNFRDAMTSMGRVTVESVARGRIDQECVQGLEISGKLSDGSRVMGMCRRGITNLAETDELMIWNVPDEWSLIEAATVPVAYATVYMSLVMMGKMRQGESILIHAGTGAVGQAAINVALHHGLDVFTTVSTPAKRAFIKRVFPQMKDSHIGQSRDTTFEEVIRRETNGKGVDLVLNSLADEKLQASAKCLKPGGRFLEIGKYDITINTQIETCFLNKGISIFGVMLDYIYEKEAYTLRQNISKLMEDGIRSGAVRPITYCTFEKHEIEKAFRYIAAGKHVGKVVIKIRDEEPAGTVAKPTVMPLSAIPRYMCHEDYVYVLIGGLGGFGLELGDWLVMRGARKLLFSSRRGVSNGYQALRLKFWQEYGAKIEISTVDVTTESGCRELLKTANAMGPVRAIFNLAVVLKDAVFNNQTPETFQTSFGPKAQATLHLDKLSRILCPVLQDFVIFSSVSCGRGNAGQTNYGFSNSVMERVCEKRKQEGLPALAIQWGAVGDVGLVADMQEENIQLEIGGTLQQRIVSCLDAVDVFLKQDAAIVSSIVVAEKKAGSSGSNNVLEVIAAILGITDLKCISRQIPLSEMGMDSVMAVEIKQALERDYELFFNAQEIRMLTFAKLTELTAENEEQATKVKYDISADDIDLHRIMKRNFGDEKRINDDYLVLPSLVSDAQEADNIFSENILFLLPGLESSAEAFRTLCSKLKVQTLIMQLGQSTQDSLEDMTNRIYGIVKERLIRGGTFALLGYSYGTIPILELAARLENDGYKGTVYCIDGSPEFATAITKEFVDCTNDDEIQKYIVLRTFNMLSSSGEELNKKLDEVKSLEERVKFAIDMLPVKMDYSEEFLISMALACYNRIKVLLKYNYNKIKKIASPIILIRQQLMSSALECNEVYGLDKFTDSPVSLYVINSDHTNIIDSEECAEIINSTLADFYKTYGKKTVEEVTVIKDKPRQIGLN